MCRSHLFLIASALLCAACADTPTDAPESPTATPDELRPSFVTGNFEEDNVHTWVGLIVFYDENGEFSHRCSGSLIEPTVFLTAGHCTAGASSARIWFAQDAGVNFDPATELDPVTGYPETCLPQPSPCVTSDELYNFGFDDFAGFPNTLDVGIVILDEPVTSVGFGELAPVGTLDALATERGQQDVSFVVSGYGVSGVRPRALSFRERLMATVNLVNLTSALNDGFNVQTSNSPGGGRGGTCFGDSGGPLLYQGQIVGVTSFGLNFNCAGVGFSYRVDREEVQDFIEDPS
jgi:Trypsin